MMERGDIVNLTLVHHEVELVREELIRCIGANVRPSMDAIARLSLALGLLDAYLKKENA